MADKCKAGRLLRHEVKPREETLWLARKEEVKEEEQIRGGEGKGGEGHPNINRCSRERKKKKRGQELLTFRCRLVTQMQNKTIHHLDPRTRRRGEGRQMKENL